MGPFSVKRGDDQPALQDQLSREAKGERGRRGEHGLSLAIDSRLVVVSHRASSRFATESMPRVADHLNVLRRSIRPNGNNEGDAREVDLVGICLWRKRAIPL